MFSRSLFISAAVVATLLIALGLRDAISPPVRYNVLLVTVESMRADALRPTTTPFLWKQAAQAIRFERHRAASAWTAANVVSLLTGLPATDHGVHTRDRALPEGVVRPLDWIAARGWAVGGVQPFMLTENFTDLGLTIDTARDPQAWMARQALAGQPFFLWYHYLDTHLPYAAGDAPPGLPPRLAALTERPAVRHTEFVYGPEDRPAIRALYDAQFDAFDRWFADLWSFLERSGLAASTVVVLTADHGEELGERGMVGHASTTAAGHLHEEIVHVPLVLWLPSSLGVASGVDTRLSSHIDVLPTVLRLLGLRTAKQLPGADLLGPPGPSVWEGVTSRAGFAEPEPDRIREFVLARVEGNWKLHLRIRDGVAVESALYDLERDPAELADRAADEPALAARLTATLRDRAGTISLAEARTARLGAEDPGGPNWIFPAANGTVSHADLPQPLVLRWTGSEGSDYRLQYEAGEGALRLGGELAVQGPHKSLGPIGRDYWNSYIVPYGRFRVRVGVPGREDLWSPWIEIHVKP